MSKQKNIEALQQFGEAINSGNLEKLHDLVAENSVEHDPAPNQSQGPEGYIQFFEMMRKAFPDLKIDVEALVADEESVAFAYRVTGTHQNDFMGIPATNNEINVRGLQISKFKDGKMVERWGSSDELGMLKQLGASLQL